MRVAPGGHRGKEGWKMGLPRLLPTLGAIAVLAVAACAPIPGAPTSTVNHLNFDPASLSNAEIAKAAALDVYFEHASVGQNVVDGISALGGRYASGRVSWSSYPAWSGDPAWFDTQDGLADYQRGNPGNVQKISFFQAAMTPALASKVEVASFKFCYIDTPADAASLFTAVRTAMESLQAAYPSVVFVWWTMPIERDGPAPAQRQAYNDAVRAYCSAHQQWLLDIADLESHDGSGAARVDGSHRELLCPAYTSDGGHLNTAGAARVAKAYWRLIAEIARAR
jgi:hypothetical protein